jgi:hypothetical protein
MKLKTAYNSAFCRIFWNFEWEGADLNIFACKKTNLLFCIYLSFCIWFLWKKVKNYSSLGHIAAVFLFGFESRHLLKLSMSNTSKAMTIHGPSLTSIANHLKNAWYRYTYVSDILDDLVLCECDGAEDAHPQLRVHKQQLLTCTS